MRTCGGAIDGSEMGVSVEKGMACVVNVAATVIHVVCMGGDVEVVSGGEYCKMRQLHT